MLKYAENKDTNDKPLSTEEDGQCDSVTELFTVITVGGGVAPQTI